MDSVSLFVLVAGWLGGWVVAAMCITVWLLFSLLWLFRQVAAMLPGRGGAPLRAVRAPAARVHAARGALPPSLPAPPCPPQWRSVPPSGERIKYLRIDGSTSLEAR